MTLLSIFYRNRAGWFLPAGILFLWEIAVYTNFISMRFMPSPSSVALAAMQKILSGELFIAICISATRAFSGLLIGGLSGFGLGVLNGISHNFRAYTDTTLQMIRNIPHVALIPLVIIWFGINENAKIFLVALGVFFPIYANTLLGIQSVDPHLLEMGFVYRLSRFQQFFKIMIPGALPSILIGLRYALGVMWLTLIIAETISTSAGLGYMTMQAREFLRIDIVVLIICIYALLGKLADSIVRFFERRLLAWHPSFQLERVS
ncbi:MAG: sulfonate transport system permease protein [Candidatus Tokpelaia sp. JSC188]|nr:MAG: sulfonate transport system permease protein [Candidatus Tokpelaia sp. JSC188]